MASRSEEIGRRVRQERERARLTLRALAGLCGLSAPMLSRIERGQVRVRVEQLEAIGAAVGVDARKFQRGKAA